MGSTFVYKNIGNCEIKGDFYPAETANAPLLVYIHGGGLIWGSRNELSEEQIRLYNNAGFNICSIDYRLAPESKLPDIIRDIQDALKWLKGEGANMYNFDSKKIAVIGSSGGGYLALLTGMFEVKPKAIVSFYGYGNIVGDWYTKPSPFFTKMAKVPEALPKMLIQPNILSEAPIEKRYGIYLYCRQQGVWNDYVIGKNRSKAELTKYCPIENIQADYPATLLLHGDKDDDVPHEESVNMSRALVEAGVSNKLITIPNGKHQFDKEVNDPHVKDAFDQVIQFLKANLDVN
ncbi:alpha/beta hydrolase [Oceanobacillus polygoni]|uniref:Acetyl esterase/lipase n=1 Tax=Oceanobacillus polygoni TaxID=1235259 RepID=A0A9X1CFY9_9BACI|nr:alpha/beta hydrolase [Oceanobacillus polygoni]MBP2076992.1 acetyl esterase/lipase [Oceanobacillus polygoni]